MAEWLMRFAVNGVGAPIESSNLSLTMNGPFPHDPGLIAYLVKHVAHNNRAAGSTPSQPI